MLLGGDHLRIRGAGDVSNVIGISDDEGGGHREQPPEDDVPHGLGHHLRGRRHRSPSDGAILLSPLESPGDFFSLFKDAMVAVNAVAENYPQLRAVESFTQLQEELTTTENKVGFARQNYNDVVRDYNDNIQVFPKNIIAGAFNFKPADTFAVETEEARRAPKVEF